MLLFNWATSGLRDLQRPGAWLKCQKCMEQNRLSSKTAFSCTGQGVVAKDRCNLTVLSVATAFLCTTELFQQQQQKRNILMCLMQNWACNYTANWQGCAQRQAHYVIRTAPQNSPWALSTFLSTVCFFPSISLFKWRRSISSSSSQLCLQAQVPKVYLHLHPTFTHIR